MAPKLFVRWNSGGKGIHKVELVSDHGVVLTSLALPDDINIPALWGYCLGVAQTYRRLGVDIQMPQCIANWHNGPDMSRED